MRKSNPALLLASVLALGACAQSNNRPRTVAGPNISTLVAIGDKMRAEGDLMGAMAFYQHASQRAPHDSTPLIREGETYIDLNSPLRAAAVFREALMVDAGSREATLGLAVADLALGQPTQAAKLLAPLVPGAADTRVLRNYGVALDLLGEQAQAQTVYRRALRIAPTDGDLHADLALSLAISGDMQGALDEMESALVAPENLPWRYADHVLLLALAGQTDDARALGERTLGTLQTADLLARADRARTAGTPAARAGALGLVDASLTPPAGPESLPAAAPVTGAASTAALAPSSTDTTTNSPSQTDPTTQPNNPGN